MPSFVPPKKNTAFIFWLGLVDRANRPLFKSSPTLAAGDVKVSIDGGALANLTTLPVVTPAASVLVKVDLSAAEMNGDNIAVVFIDAAGAEWDDVIATLQTTARQIDDLATAAALVTVQADTDDLQTRLPAALVGGRMDSSVGAYASGQAPLQPTVAGRTLDVTATGEAGLDFDNTAGTLAKGTDITGFNDLSAAQVKAEVVDALNVDTYAEPAQGTPAATTTLAAKINFLYKAWRNRFTQTASQYSLYNDDAVTVDHKSTVSDNGTTFDRAEVATGP